MRLAKETDVPAPAALEIMAKCAEVAGQFKQMAGEFPVSRNTVNDIARRVETNRQRM